MANNFHYKNALEIIFDIKIYGNDFYYKNALVMIFYYDNFTWYFILTD